MYAKTILAAIFVSVLLNSVEAYVLEDLVQKLSGYDKKWVSGINSKFVDMTLEETKKLMGTRLPINP